MNYIQVKRSWWNQCKSRVFAFRRSLSRDFDYSTDYFFGFDFLMAVSGGRLKSRNVKLRAYWNIYRVLITIPLIIVIRNCFVNITNGSDFGIVLSSIQTLLSVFVTVLQLILILWHYNSLMALRCYVKNRRFGRSLQPCLGIRRDAFNHSRKIVSRIIAVMIMGVATIPALNISRHHTFKLPYDSSMPIVQYLCEKAFLCFLAGFGFMTLVVHLVPYMILTGLEAEVKVIAQTFSVIFENTDQRVQWRMEGEACSVWQIELKMKYYFWKFAKEELGKCIDLHVEFLAMLNRVRPMLNRMFYVMYYSTALCMACGAMYLASLKTVTLFSLQTSFYLLLIAFECVTLSRMVSFLNEAHQSIGNEVYDLHWPMRLECEDLFIVEHRSVCKIITVVITVSQQPLRLNGLGRVEFTQDRFWALLNLAYNFYNVLNDYNDCCVANTAP